MRLMDVNLVCAAVIGAAMLFVMTSGGEQAKAKSNDAAPGQLTIMGKDGKPGGLCPLKHTDVQAEISGFVARVTVTQAFENPSKEAIEAIYTFPLPNDAAVDDMTMTIGSRVIRGQIKKREEAREIYEAAKAHGHAAALLDQERPNIFTQSVANIMPGEKIKITISYIQLLKYEEGVYEFVFPMVVGPRYIPGAGGLIPTTGVTTDPEKISPPITPDGTRAGHDISLTVKLDAGLPISELKSQLHQVDIKRVGDTRAEVSLNNQNEIPNKDFILKFSAFGSDIQSGLLTFSDGHGGGYFTLIMQPPNAPMEGRIMPKEMIFVIDQSGSQSGFPIEKSKETVLYCIQHMNPGDTFNVIGFSTIINRLFDKPVPNTPENVAKAEKFVKGLSGDGGTELLPAFLAALEPKDDPERLRIVSFMTDGYVGNDLQILDALQKNRRSARIFPFGIGNGVNRFLIDGMASEGKGQAEFVTLDTPGIDPAERFYRRIAKPLLIDVQVDWHGMPVADMYPKDIPDIFTAGPVVIKGRYTAGAEGDIEIIGMLRGKPWRQTLHVVFPKDDKDGSAIATLWARAKIDDLLRQDYMGAQTGKPDPNIKDQIVNTALEYRLMSQYTSFVAVEEKVINTNGSPRTIQVPVEMPEGVSYEGIFGPAERGPGLVKSRMKSSYGGAVSGGGVPSSPVMRSPSKFALHEESLDADAGIPTQVPKTHADRVKLKLKPPLNELSKLLKEKGKNGSLSIKGKLEVKDNKVEIQIWLTDLKPETLKKLKGLGFELTYKDATMKLVIGRILVKNIEKLADLDTVKTVEPPSYK
jgi:Ca-activated chloride channel family protein